LNRKTEVICLGETMLMVSPHDGQPLSESSSCGLHPGGAESNVAMNLAALGHNAAWVSRLGDDPIGRIIEDTVAAAGVDVSQVERDPLLPTGVYFKNPGPDGTSVHYYRKGSAASMMNRALIDGIHDKDVRVIHLSGVTAALSVSAKDLTEYLVNDRPFGSALLSFDVNYRPSLWNGDAPQALLALAQACDIVFVGLDEAQTLWGTRTAEDVRELISKSGVLVVKDGSREAVTFTEHGVTRVPAQPVQVVERVGAGDAFAGGWLSGLLRGLTQEDRLQLGHLVAARVLRSTSDTASLPPWELLCLEMGEGSRQGRNDESDIHTSRAKMGSVQ
jgi:2-dehydro-3-deoxygluconokinase